MARAKHEIIALDESPVSVAFTRRRGSEGYLAWHEAMEIHFIRAGSGSYFVDGETVMFRSNSAVVIQPREIHRFVPVSGGRIEKACIMFNPGELDLPETFVKDLKKMRRYVGLAAEESGNMNQAVCRIIRENKVRGPGWQPLVRVLLMEFLLRLKRSENNALPCAPHQVVRRALGYIERHYASPDFNIADLADELNISERHLLRLFFKDIGMSIKHYVMQKRIFQAQRIIRSRPALKLEAVSEAVGFRQYTLFYRMFRNFTGVSPCVYVRF